MQLVEAKKRADESQMEVEEYQGTKRKLDKEMEGLQDRIDELTAENSKVVKSKKKVQEEVSEGQWGHQGKEGNNVRGVVRGRRGVTMLVWL